MPAADTGVRMRPLALILLALGLSATAAIASVRAPGGSLSVTDGRGLIQITGKGTLVGRIDKGSLKIVDLTPTDQWSPFVNGVPRGKVVWLKGHDIGFRISKGRYLIIARGEGISISAYGTGNATVDGEPDQVGSTGMYRVGDGQRTPLPDVALKILFGSTDAVAASSG